jgi:hypothetical protein
VSYDARANAAAAVEHDPARSRLEAERDDGLTRMAQALFIARDLPTFLALLDGQTVPMSRCHRDWIERYDAEVEHDE